MLFSALFLRFRERARTAPPAGVTIEGLEGRQLWSVAPLDVPTPVAGPQVIGEQLIGSNRAVTAIVLTFDRALNPTTAQDVDAYIVQKHTHTDAEDGGLFDSFVPFLDTSKGATHGLLKLRLDSAVYDDAARTVTITPHHAFQAFRRFRQLRIDGKGDHAIKDLAGNRLDGKGNGGSGENELLKFKARRGHGLRLTDNDGDHLTLHLRGPGTIVSLTHRHFKGDPSPLVFLEDTSADNSILTGTVKPGRHGDGVFHLSQLSGISTAQVSFLNDPAFAIALTQA